MGSLSHPSHQGQDRSPPPQGEQPIPSSLQGQHRRKGRIQFSTALSVKHTPLPQAPSDSPLAHTWDRNSVPALGSTEKLRKARARPTQTHSALAPTPSPYPALLRWFFLGIKLTLGQISPAEVNVEGREGCPTTLTPPSLCTGCSQSYMLFLLTQRKILLGQQHNSTALTKSQDTRIQGSTLQTNNGSVGPPAK